MIKIFLVSVLLTSCGFEVVDTGYRGLETRFGEIVSKPLPEGLYFYNPFTSSINEIDVRERITEGQTPAFTKDTQNVNISYALTYYPDPTKVDELYKQFGLEWEPKIIAPAVLSSMKDAVGRYNADELVQKREESKTAAYSELKEALSTRGIMATRLDLTNLDFDDQYEAAVEAKVTAVQRASESKNKTIQIQEEADQKIISAEAEAKSMQIRAAALSQNKGLVEYEMVQKWNGVLPTIMTGGNSLIQIPKEALGGK